MRRTGPRCTIIKRQRCELRLSPVPRSGHYPAIHKYKKGRTAAMRCFLTWNNLKSILIVNMILFRRPYIGVTRRAIVQINVKIITAGMA